MYDELGPGTFKMALVHHFDEKKVKREDEEVRACFCSVMNGYFLNIVFLDKKLFTTEQTFNQQNNPILPSNQCLHHI